MYLVYQSHVYITYHEKSQGDSKHDHTCLIQLLAAAQKEKKKYGSIIQRAVFKSGDDFQKAMAELAEEFQKLAILYR